MMEKKNILNIKNILRDFSGLAEARRNHTFRTKLVFIFSAVTIAMVLLFAYRVVNGAMNKILVVNEGGEFVHFTPCGPIYSQKHLYTFRRKV